MAWRPGLLALVLVGAGLGPCGGFVVPMLRSVRPLVQRMATVAPEPWEVELTGASPLVPGSLSPLGTGLGAGIDELRNLCQQLTRAVLREVLVVPALARLGVDGGDGPWTGVAEALGVTVADLHGPDGQRLDRARAKELVAQRFEDAASWEREDAVVFLECLFHVWDTGAESAAAQTELLRPTQPYSQLYVRFAQAVSVGGCTLEGDGASALVPLDYNICSSVADAALPPEDGAPPSITRFLNGLANDVARVLINGADEDATLMAQGLENMRGVFLERYGLSDAGEGASIGPISAEDDMLWFYDALTNLCDSGMATAIAQEESARARAFCWANAMQRLLGLLVQELGLRLEGAGTLEDPIFTRFVIWESQLRQNITSSAWNSYPADLEGTWCLRSFLTSYTESSTPAAPGMLGDACTMRLCFDKSGSGVVKVPAGPDQSLSWSLSPGPTHLDTCTIVISTGDAADLLFTGYIDRGQRLETKFSKRPVRMSGRVVRRRRDELGVDRPMGKFAMEMFPKSRQASSKS